MAYSATNTLTGLIPTVYTALDKVSRELVGAIPAVARDSKVDEAYINQTVRASVCPSLNAVDVEAGVLPNPSGITWGYKDVTITNWKAVRIAADGEEDLSSVKMEDAFAQAFRTITNLVEASITELYKYASNAYGTAAITPFGTAGDLSDLSQVRKILADNGASMDDIHLIMNTSAGANLRGKMSNLFKVNEYGNGNVLNFGNIAGAPLEGFSLHESAKIASHTAGTAPNIKAAAAASLGATTITIQGVSSGTLAVGDVISFANSSTVKYVVQTAVADVDTATVVTIPAPGLKVAVTQNEVATKAASYTPNIALARNAIVLATRIPKRANLKDAATDVTVVTDPISGLSYELAQYGTYRKGWYELSLLWGVAVNKPEHMALLLG